MIVSYVLAPPLQDPYAALLLQSRDDLSNGHPVPFHIQICSELPLYLQGCRSSADKLFRVEHKILVWVSVVVVHHLLDDVLADLSVHCDYIELAILAHLEFVDELHGFAKAILVFG